jgi:hypothetical protein
VPARFALEGRRVTLALESEATVREGESLAIVLS